MIKKAAALKGFAEYHKQGLANLIYDNALRIKRDNYEYIFNPAEIKYVGNGNEFLIYNLAEPMTFDGTNFLTIEDALTIGGRDFQISGRVNESAADMIPRRKIFELYTSQDLNLSLYSSGAGKNLDLFVCCGGTFDNYSEPAILEREYSFALKWLQESATLKLYVDGEEIYSVEGAGFTQRTTFERLLLGASVYHENATWRGAINEFKIYDGYSNGE